jgi:hypothetical protein
MSRRPVLDRALRTVGFEIIFPDGARGIETWQGELASDHHPAYLKVTAAYLLEHDPLPFDPSGVVLELGATLASTGSCSAGSRSCARRAFASSSTTSATALSSTRCSRAPTA